MERRVSISRKQHDLLARLIATQTDAQRQLETACNAILAALDDEPPKAALLGVTADNGVYTLNLEVPDIAPAPAPAAPALPDVPAPSAVEG